MVVVKEALDRRGERNEKELVSVLFEGIPSGGDNEVGQYVEKHEG